MLSAHTSRLGTLSGFARLDYFSNRLLSSSSLTFEFPRLLFQNLFVKILRHYSFLEPSFANSTRISIASFRLPEIYSSLIHSYVTISFPTRFRRTPSLDLFTPRLIPFWPISYFLTRHSHFRHNHSSYACTIRPYSIQNINTAGFIHSFL